MVRDKTPEDPNWKSKAGKLQKGDTVKLKDEAADRYAVTREGNLVKAGSDVSGRSEGIISGEPIFRGGALQCRIDIGDQPKTSIRPRFYWYKAAELEKVGAFASELLDPVGANPLKADDDLVKTRGANFFDFFDSGDADSEAMLDLQEWKAGLKKLAENSPAKKSDDESIILRDPETYKQGIEYETNSRSVPVVVQMLQLLTRPAKGKEKKWQDDMQVEMFNAIDTNGNGLITKLEFQKHFLDGSQHSWWVEDEEAALTCAALDREKMRGKPCKEVTVLHFRWLVTKNWFNTFIVIMVVLNCCVLGYAHYGMDPDTKELLESLNLVCTIIFVIEMVLKMFALSVSGYLSDDFNKFDCFIVVLSIVELMIPGESAGLSVFRAMRILRVFKVARSLENFQKVLVSVITVLPELGYFAMLVLLFVFFFAVMGLHLFGGTLDVLVTGNEDFDPVLDELPRANFDTFGFSVLAVFQMLTGENWNTLMYDTVKANGPLAFIYFVIVIVFGVFMLLNLFLAVLLEKSQRAFMPPRPLREDIMHRSGNTPPPKSLYAVEDDFECQGVSLFLFKPDNGIRLALKSVVSNSKFDALILVCIIISSLSLAVEEPDQKKEILDILDQMDLIFNIIFTFEMFAKIAVLGFLFGSPYAYLKDSWNILDGTIVVIAWASRLLESSIGDVSFVKGFRVLRALRPLRVIKRIPELKLVVNSIFLSFPTLGNVLLLLTMYWLVFGILGLQLFGGKLYACNDPDVINQTECVGAYLHDCGDIPLAPWVVPTDDIILDECHGAGITFDGHVLSERKWEPPVGWGFDHIGQALVTLFEVSTLEMWLDIMYWAIDAAGEGVQPVQNYNAAVSVFFVIFIIFGSFFMLELFVGAIVTSYNMLNEQNAGGAFQSARQMQQVAKLALRKKDEDFVPTYEYQVGLYKIMVETPFVEKLISAFIVLNIAVMALSCYDMDNDYEDTLNLFNDIFTWIFALECILQIAAQLPKRYFSSGWNQYDCFVVVVTVGDFMYTKLSPPDSPEIPGAMVLRVFRIARIIRLLRKMKNLFGLFLTVAHALPTLVNIGAILCLVYFIFAVFGMHIFGGVKHGEFLNVHANFDSFPKSLLTVFRMSTGESWNGIMHDCSVSTDCNSESNCAMGTCCGSPISPFFFVAFQLLGQYIMLNLFIAVMLEYYQRQQDSIDGYVTETDHEMFEKTWEKFVGKRLMWDGSKVQFEVCQLLPVELFDDFMTALPASIGWTLTERRDPKQKRKAMLDNAPLSRLPVRSMQLVRPFLPNTRPELRNSPKKWIIQSASDSTEMPEGAMISDNSTNQGIIADQRLLQEVHEKTATATQSSNQSKTNVSDIFMLKDEPLTAITEQHYFHFREVWHTLYNRTEESHLYNEDLHPDDFRDEEARKRAQINHKNIMLQTHAKLIRDVNVEADNDARLYLKLDKPESNIDAGIPQMNGCIIYTLEQVNAARTAQRVYRIYTMTRRKMRRMHQAAFVDQIFDELWSEEMQNADAEQSDSAAVKATFANFHSEPKTDEYSEPKKELQLVLMRMVINKQQQQEETSKLKTDVITTNGVEQKLPSDATRELYKKELLRPLSKQDTKVKIDALRSKLKSQHKTTPFDIFLARLKAKFSDLPSYEAKPRKKLDELGMSDSPSAVNIEDSKGATTAVALDAAAAGVEDESSGDLDELFLRFLSAENFGVRHDRPVRVKKEDVRSSICARLKFNEEQRARDRERAQHHNWAAEHIKTAMQIEEHCTQCLHDQVCAMQTQSFKLLKEKVVLCRGIPEWAPQLEEAEGQLRNFCDEHQLASPPLIDPFIGWKKELARVVSDQADPRGSPRLDVGAKDVLWVYGFGCLEHLGSYKTPSDLIEVMKYLQLDLGHHKVLSATWQVAASNGSANVLTVDRVDLLHRYRQQSIIWLDLPANETKPKTLDEVYSTQTCALLSELSKGGLLHYVKHGMPKRKEVNALVVVTTTWKPTRVRKNAKQDKIAQLASKEMAKQEEFFLKRRQGELADEPEEGSELRECVEFCSGEAAEKLYITPLQCA
eukprot:SAG31_NODE_1029_length_10253_cov_2.979515_3_plen_2033_part_00